MYNLTPSDLFSPSKARQQRAQAQDWAHIDSWLSYKYNGRTVPTFERNEETLKVLQELSMANERADEERSAKESVEREALKELDEEATKHVWKQQMLQHITASLRTDGRQALQALASTSVILNTTSAAPETLAHTLIQHTITSQHLSNQLAHVQTLQNYLDKQHAQLRAQLHELTTNPAFVAPPSLSRQTAEQTRQVKHVRNKIRECEDRFSSVQHSNGCVLTPASKDITCLESLGEMVEQQKFLDTLGEQIKELESEVSEYAELPANKDMARKEVAKLEVQLDTRRRRRDELFEGLVKR